ncbi:Mu transposase C-terminal domain-containing protein [Streptomyces poriferorum]|uniref:Mu transposase C-terminal domain-containing protein n=1 Tax=Streptomyces poriferorum TaxID=2798799 RepID=A0ABY9IFQ2_9ACTN|nr:MULTISPECIES: Mu transposase C-terminal domain-containing protein [unclassified Streptomyces]MDP5315654.1 Mu transposase C-terminal domain-containing protein [Streptomyces sp. Alt4]WLQ54022.1 Mu transposase C-terminal domain-containing protein [Streptomyces sp. Alt2]
MHRLYTLEQSEQLTRSRITGVADAFGVDTRTVDRWLANARANNGTYQPRDRPRFTLTQLMLDAVARWRGNATAAWRELRAEGHPVPSLPTFHRAANRALTPGMRAGLRGGEKVRRHFDVAGERDRHYRNYAWETDHVEASVKVRVEGHIRKPWITFFIDAATSAICGLAITPQRPSREAVLVAIRDAILIDEHHGPFGGIPMYVRVDGGKEFLCATVKEALGALGSEIIALPPFTPEGKGNVEAVNGAIKKTLFAGMPGYTHAPTLRGGKPVDPDQPLLHFEAFVTLVLEWVHHWNHENTLRSLDGRTPHQAWNADPALIGTVTAEDLHTYTLERHGKPLTINNGGVRWRKRNYIADWMHGRVGEKVSLRYLPHHDHRIELYDPETGRRLGAAVMAKQATPEQTLNLKRARRREADRLRTQLKRAEKNRNTRYAAATRPAPPVPLDVLPEEEALEHLRALDGFDPAAEALPDFIQLPAPDADWTMPRNPNPSTQPPTHPQDQP